MTSGVGAPGIPTGEGQGGSGGQDWKSLLDLEGNKDIYSSKGKDYGNFTSFADAYNLFQDLLD